MMNEEPTASRIPLSFAEEGLWFLDQLAPGSAAYNESIGLWLRGPLDFPALAASLAELVRRHEALRTTYRTCEGAPEAVIAPAFQPTVHRVDLSGIPGGEEEALRALVAEAAVPFDLARGPLLRIVLVRFASDDHRLHLSIHHSVYDAASREILLRELGRLYAAFSSGCPSPLPPPLAQARDSARWQRERQESEEVAAQLAFWRDRLAGLPEISLPADRPSPPEPSGRGARLAAAFPVRGLAPLGELGRRQGTSPFMLLLAVFVELLHRYTGESDLPIGTTVSSRNRLDFEEIVGFLTNTLVLRTVRPAEATFVELLEQVRQVTLEALANQEVPFERVVQELQPRRRSGRHPLFQVMFMAQPAPWRERCWGNLQVTPFEVYNGTAKFDLLVHLYLGPDELTGGVELSTDRFDRTTVQRLLAHFGRLLEGVAAAPERPLAELSLLTAGERHQLLAEWNATTAERPSGALVQELFTAQVARTPDRVAVGRHGEVLTYGTLDGRSNRLANHLRGLGAGPEARIGLAVDRSAEMVVALLAILKAGAAYVPLDPADPAERLALLLDDARPALLVAEEPFLSRLTGSQARVVCLDRDRWTAAIPGPPARWTDEAGLAYVLYTSGSTGRPKGVEVSHRAVVNLLVSMARRPGLAADGVLPALATLSFDIAGLEIYLPLLVGARVELLAREEAIDGRLLGERLAALGASFVQATPSGWRLLVESGWTGRAGLTALSGGEALPRDLAEAILAGGVLLWNGYGPTEAAIYTAAGEVRPGAGPVGMGRPLDNVRLYVVDRSFAPVPVGVPGELWIGGTGLARGYLGRPELTAAAFVPDPFSGEPGARLYQTGDRVRYRADGTLEFLGRLDHQVKIRGHRVEPGEIEAGLCRHPAVAQALVTARGEGIEHRLVAYWIAREAAAVPDAAELRAFLRTLLPEPLVPSAFVRLPAFPASPTGKVDRGALPEPESTGEEGTYRAPHGPVEVRLARLWAELLGIERVGADDDFFALGGHSLLATRLVSRLRQTEGIELPVRQLFAAPTPARLAAVLQKVVAAGERSAGPALRPAPRPAELPLSYAQERLWFVEQMERDDSLHSMPSAFRLRGDLAIPVLAASLGEIVCRHEALRTRFAVHGGRPVQVIDAGWRPGLPLVDLGGLPQETATAELDRRMAGEEALSFDLAKGPLLRITLIRCVDDIVLLVTFHHLVADGWSIGVFLHELAEIYPAFHQGKPSPLPELSLQYADFALWQRERLRGDILARQLEYWQGKLAGLKPLDLPADRPAVPGQAFPAGHHSFILAARCTAHIDRFRRQGMSPFMVLLAAFQALLHRHTGQTDIAVGVPIANRNRHEIEGLIGFFVNTLVLRTEAQGHSSFRELLARVRETTLEAYDHQDLPFSRLVEALRPDRRQGSLPFVDVMLTLEGTARPGRLPGMELTVLPYRQGVDLRIDAALSLHFLESAGELSGWLGYNTKRFDRTTAARWRDHFLNLLAAAVETPDGPLGELPLLGAAERHQVQVEWGEGGERVRAGDRPASIGIWGEMAERGRFRRRADGSLEAWGSARSPAAGPAAPGAVTPDTLAQKQAALASRRESLSATKQALLDRLLRGQAPTRPAAARTAPAFLVKLHSGAPGRSPLFLTHAMGGAVFSYAELARRLGAQPAYGVQSPALESGTPIDDLPAMAAAYVAAVEAAAPSGPLLLGGWSFGGVVAFEMACQLAARGREVALLALFDSWTPALVQPPAEVDDAELHRLFLADQGSAESPPGLHAKPLQAVLDVYRANLRAYATYRPRPYPGRLTLFRPLLAPEETRPHPTNGWEALTREPIEVYTVPGDHFSMLAPPHVDRLAAGLSGAIEAADRIEEAG